MYIIFCFFLQYLIFLIPLFIILNRLNHLLLVLYNASLNKKGHITTICGYSIFLGVKIFWVNSWGLKCIPFYGQILRGCSSFMGKTKSRKKQACGNYTFTERIKPYSCFFFRCVYYPNLSKSHKMTTDF